MFLCKNAAMKSITEAQYELLKPYLPVQRGNVRISNLTLINAILYVAENSCKWRTLPLYPPSKIGQKWYFEPII
jgi:transposase